MTEFKILNDMFENQSDYYKMFNKYGEDATKYALLRSLTDNYIKEFLGSKIDTSKSDDLLEAAYNSDVTIEEIVNYMLSKRMIY